MSKQTTKDELPDLEQLDDPEARLGVARHSAELVENYAKCIIEVADALKTLLK